MRGGCRTGNLRVLEAQHRPEDSPRSHRILTGSVARSDAYSVLFIESPECVDLPRVWTRPNSLNNKPVRVVSPIEYLLGK